RLGLSLDPMPPTSSVPTRPIRSSSFFFFFFNDTATTEIYTLSLHDALPFYNVLAILPGKKMPETVVVLSAHYDSRSEEHTSELQSLTNLVCRLLLEKKK